MSLLYSYFLIKSIFTETLGFKYLLSTLNNSAPNKHANTWSYSHAKVWKRVSHLPQQKVYLGAKVIFPSLPLKIALQKMYLIRKWCFLWSLLLGELSSRMASPHMHQIVLSCLKASQRDYILQLSGRINSQACGMNETKIYVLCLGTY